MFGFLASLASKFIPTLFGLGSKILPAVSKAVAVGKAVIPKVASAVGKVANGIATAKAVGKAVKGAVGSVAPEATKKVEEAYNKKIIGGRSLGDLVESGERGIGKVKDVADRAKAVMANIPIGELDLTGKGNIPKN